MRIKPSPQPHHRAAPREPPAVPLHPHSVRGRAIRAALWSIIGLCLAGYAASLAVPLWYQLHDQRLLIVTSGSMAPYFVAGDAVVMQQIADPSQLRVGQVASFWPPGSDLLVTHRITELKMLPLMERDAATGAMAPRLDPATGTAELRPYILTKGDANADGDANATPLARVRGVVLDVHPQWGTVLAWVHSSSGRWTVLTPPLAILAALEITAVTQLRRNRPVHPETRSNRAVVDDILLT